MLRELAGVSALLALGACVDTETNEVSSASDCVHQGRRYLSGETIPSGDCNACSCNEGQIACTTRLCDAGAPACVGDGGATRFPSPNGDCNTCSCVGGALECTTLPCPLEPPCVPGESCGSDCTEVDAACWACGELHYDDSCACVPEATACGGKQEECSGSGPAKQGQACGSQWWCDRACEEGLDCVVNDPCALGADYRRHCAPKGTMPPTCQPAEAACSVGGVVYASGSRSVQDPFSCNRCECKDGLLQYCTEAACPNPCPSDTLPGSRCIRCGPADSCEVFETGCFPACKTDADCKEAQHPVCGSKGVCVSARCG